MISRYMRCLQMCGLLTSGLLILGCGFNPEQAVKQAERKVEKAVNNAVDKTVNRAAEQAVAMATGGAVQSKNGTWTVTVPEGQFSTGPAAPTPAGFPAVPMYPGAARLYAGTTAPKAGVEGAELPVSVVALRAQATPDQVLAFYQTPPPGFTTDGPATAALAASGLPIRLYQSADPATGAVRHLAIIAQAGQAGGQAGQAGTQILYLCR